MNRYLPIIPRLPAAGVFIPALALTGLLAGVSTELRAHHGTEHGDRAVSKSNADLVLRDAYLAQARGRVKEAIRLYDKYLSVGPPSAYVHSEFAIMLSIDGKHERAVEQARRAIALKPRVSRYRIRRADVLRRAGRASEALALLEKAVSEFENDAEIEFELAETYYRLKQRKKARLHYRQVLFHVHRLGSRRAQVHNISLWRLANLHLESRERESARLYLVRFIRRNPRQLLARFLLGYFLYYRGGDFPRARRQLEIIAASPGLARRQRIDLDRVHGALGKIYFVQGHERAGAYLKKVARKDVRGNYLEKALLHITRKEYRPGAKYLLPFLKLRQRPPYLDFIARIALLELLENMKRRDLLAGELVRTSVLAHRIGRHAAGIRLLRRALKIKEANPAEKVSRSFLNRRIARHFTALKQPHRAVLYLRRALDGPEPREGEDYADLKLTLARVLSSDEVRRFDEAADLCNQVVAAMPKYSRAYYRRGQVYLKMRRNDAAVADFSRAIGLRENFYPYYFYRAFAKHEQKDFDGTVKDLEKVIALNDGIAAASNFLGYIYAEKGVKIEEAARLIRRAVELSPTNGAYQDSLGWVYYRQGRYQRARYHLNIAALLLEDEGREDPVVYDHLGDVYQKLNYPARALSAYKRALRVLDVKRRNRPADITPDDRALEKKVRAKIARLARTGNNKEK